MKKISELEMNRKYKIEYIQRTETNDGDMLTVGLEGKIFCYLPTHMSKVLLANGEAYMREVDVEVQTATLGLRRLPQHGRIYPVSVRIVPNDCQDE